MDRAMQSLLRTVEKTHSEMIPTRKCFPVCTTIVLSLSVTAGVVEHCEKKNKGEDCHD